MKILHLQALLHALLGRQAELSGDSANSDPRAAYLALLKGTQRLQHPHPDLEAAIQAFEEAIILYDRAGDERFKSLVQKIVGVLFEMIDDAARARLSYNSAVKMLEAASLRGDVARTHLHFAKYELQHGRHAEALAALRKALDLFRAIGHTEGESEALMQFSEVEFARGQRNEAHAYAREAAAFLPLIDDISTRISIETRAQRVLAA